MKNVFLERIVLLLIIATVIFFIPLLFINLRYSRLQNKHLSISKGTSSLADWANKTATEYPYYSIDKSGTFLNPNDASNLIIAGKINNIEKNRLEIKTFYGLFLVNLNSNTKYFSWNKKLGISSTKEKTVDDFQVGTQVYVRCTTDGDNLIALDVQEILNE